MRGRLEGSGLPANDTGRAHPARVHDHLLGGKDNLAACQAIGEQVKVAGPSIGAKRAFLQRAVRSLAGELGIGRFLEIGTGLPTQGRVHEAALAVRSDARVAYADNDPIAHVSGNALLAGTATTVLGDLRQPVARDAHRFTVDPGQMRQADVQALRRVGLDDSAIVDANHPCAHLNYVNRVANGLGLHDEVGAAFPASCHRPPAALSAHAIRIAMTGHHITIPDDALGDPTAPTLTTTRRPRAAGSRRHHLVVAGVYLGLLVWTMRLALHEQGAQGVWVTIVFWIFMGFPAAVEHYDRARGRLRPRRPRKWI